MASAAIASIAQPRRAAQPVSVAIACIIAAAAAWCALAPLQASVCTVFLFAGPHNWMEARYFLARMPVRWAASRTFFLTAGIGIAILAPAQAALYWMPSWIGAWNLALCVWIAVLCVLHGRELKRDSLHVVPAALAAGALATYAPELFGLALVYVHPLVALWFFERQIRVSRPEWLSAVRRSMLLVPAAVALLGFSLAGSAPLAADDPVAFAITQHAGSSTLPIVSSHMLVAIHVFLETLHYAVWIVALPLLGLRTRPWNWREIPLMRHRLGWPKLTAFTLITGAASAIVLWGCFLLDYAATRQVYFTVAVVHVLAEVPFLIRLRS